MAETYYAWNPVFDCITKEVDASGATIAEYTHEPKLYGGLISQHRSGVTSVYHYDAIGTTRALTNSSQTVTDTAVYTAFGEKVAANGLTTMPYGYVGHYGYHDSGSAGPLGVRFRTYTASTAKWTSPDPLGNTSLPVDAHIFTTNLYGYCNNRPVALCDPAGLAPCATNCGSDITRHLKELFAAFEREFNRHLAYPVFRLQAKTACYEMVSLAGWDVKQLMSHKNKFIRGGRRCGWDQCYETVTVNRECYKPEEVNYYLWGLASRLCFDAGFARTQTATQTVYVCTPYTGVPAGAPSCQPIEEVVPGEFTEEWAVKWVESYRNWLLFGWIWTSAKKGRVEWTRAGYKGELNAPSATLEKLYDIHCTACPHPYRGPMEASIGARNSESNNSVRASVVFWDDY